MLILIGLGLGKGDISAKALESIKKADSVFYEEYTASIEEGYIEWISKTTGKELKKIPRTSMEDNLKETVIKAKDSDIAILVPGDPLIATTHHILVEEAASKNIKTQIFHAPSIFTAAIGESGLDIYKFGPTATIPKFSKNYKPVSFINTIRKNLSNGQHTLILFDVTEEGTSISAETAVSTLLEHGKGAVGPETKIILISDIGKEGQNVSYAEISGILTGQKSRKTGSACMILPAGMSFAEEHAVSMHANSSI